MTEFLTTAAATTPYVIRGASGVLFSEFAGPCDKCKKLTKWNDLNRYIGEYYAGVIAGGHPDLNTKRPAQMMCKACAVAEPIEGRLP